MTDWTVRRHCCKLKQNANEDCNSYARLAGLGLVLCFIACFILLVIAPLHKQLTY